MSDSQMEQFQKVKNEVSRSLGYSRRRFPSEPIDAKTKAEMELIQKNSDKYILAPQKDATGMVKFIPIGFCEKISGDIREHALFEIRQQRMFTVEEVADWKAQLEAKVELDKIGKLAEKFHSFCAQFLSTEMDYTTKDAFYDAFNKVKKTGIKPSIQLEYCLRMKALVNNTC